MAKQDGPKINVVVIKGVATSNQKGAGFTAVPYTAVLPAVIAVRINDTANIVLTAAELQGQIAVKVRDAIVGDAERFGVTLDTTCAGGKGGKRSGTAVAAAPDDITALLG